MSIPNYNFERYGNWNIFKNDTISDINLSDCNDTINGVCEETNTLEECIDICQNDPLGKCNFGYYIQKDGKKYCVPLREYSKEIAYPYYRIRNRNYYPSMKHAESTVFVNSKYPFPPISTNTMFFGDYFALKNSKTGKFIGRDKDIITFSDTPVMLQFTSNSVNRDSNYVQIENGNNVIIISPKTTYIMYKSNDNAEVKWMMRESSIGADNSIFAIHSENPSDTTLDYTGKYYFTYNGNVLELNQFGFLSISDKSYEKSSENGDNIFFEFVPKVEVYYCDKSCKKTTLEECVMNDDTATYNGHVVYRNPNCWGQCKSNKTFIIILICLVFLIGIILSFRYR